MKLQCDVEVVNRMLPSFGMKSRGKGVRAVVSIGKHLDKSSQRSNIYMMICTAKDRTGSKYKLRNNIEKFFTWFVEEGKATVRLKEPAVDVCLSKADANSLKNFLSAARLADRGSDTSSLPLSTLTPVRARDVEQPKKKLSVMSKKDYPLTSNFPYSLEQLQVSYCKLSRVDMRMLSLKALRRLDLSNNHIKKLPATIGDLGCLSELILHNNHLEAFSEALCLSTLQQTLQVLDLSQNRLQSLPARFCQLRELMNLKLDDNKLAGLPLQIGRLSKLRFLSAAHNQLTVLPADFFKLSLENLDLFGNPFIQPNPLDHTMQLAFPLPLQEIASRAVADLRIPYGPHLIPAHLCGELEAAKTCECGRVCVSFHIKTAVSMNLHQVSHTVVLVDDMGGTDAPVQQHFCSLSCYSEFLDGCLQRGLR
ncbi:leucine-rich repeat protein 1 [Poecilia latipinna]|uniref:Leucine rich repeat protein 1 n=3 Tax=Poecilia TaxID=8080 RepID=A0A087XH47_POEFO|nr:PREDICTED: leucine-rich repeat protein 1 [Poecilia formosa]XP_007561193.1 PREDICTED: leucine-rich repeat protein 1 [Poecilia formosa]XP_014857532.1 PREDICTED: leucine-rich repeat protein 1 [Poecilia mexicana]XP_014857533.1 PREDICTED: leucine-rich repeat protein 1 [Poecilia mexicana]XP_014857534.1 PREDICTED: leucine-rich repeat protein 1 [Poecilia mexicana]XP_014857536.1 PREDICTED: leucine-rich repeat protein 1 [Poecilia mexicana]XP_014898954.1 PREDICTED: leucine-rich repeat protein 1 [Poec